MPLNRIDFKGDWQQKMEYLQKHEENLANQCLEMQDFEDAIKNVRPSVPQHVLKRYHDWSEKQGSD